MITSEQVNLIVNAQEQLFNCTTEDEVKKVFEDSKIDDIDAKINLLWRSMQLQNVYAIHGEEPLTKEKFYEEALAFFINGPWRELV